jgi:ADP-ribosyl-[dinitrogen reductase] hydrolase
VAVTLMPAPPPPTRRNRIRGGLVGLLVGDALGVPYEFHRPEVLPSHDAIEYSPPPGFERSHSGVPPGTWSDDGAQALCLLATLLDRGCLDLEDFSRRLVRWYDEGYLAVDGIVFDIGITTGRAIRGLRAGALPQNAGPAGADDNGNGSMMRVLPLALWHQGTDEELVRDAQLQSRVTHGHMRSQVCCALYCLWARRMLEGSRGPWDAAVSALRGLYREDDEALRELEGSIRPDELIEGTGSGYVVDCLRSARVALGQDTYRDVVRAAVKLGRDTDTSACVAGGLAGIRDGIECIPFAWRDGLRGRDLYEPLLQRLLEWTDGA